MNSVVVPGIAVRDEFDMYGIRLELGEWSYVLDQPGVVYGPGWYPFHESLARVEPDPSAPLLNRMVSTGRTRPVGVRLSPGTEPFSWRNEYVQLEPCDHRILVRTTLFVCLRGLGAVVRGIRMVVDLRNGSVVLPEDCPVGLRGQAEVKGRRVVDLLFAARRERRRGASLPTAVLGQWERETAIDRVAARDDIRRPLRRDPDEGRLPGSL